MGITKSTVKVGQKPTKEQLKQIREIAKQPVHYTSIMADVPNYVADNPEILSKVRA